MGKKHASQYANFGWLQKIYKEISNTTFVITNISLYYILYYDTFIYPTQ